MDALSLGEPGPTETVLYNWVDGVNNADPAPDACTTDIKESLAGR